MNKTHDILFMVKKNAYIHKYKEPFVLKNIDDAMELLDRVVNERGNFKKKKLYACFGDLVQPKDSEKYYQYVAAISVSEEDIYKYNEDKSVLAPAMIDVLQGLWWSIINKKGFSITKEGKVIHEDE